jgi:MoxR-like ATPase
MGKSSIMRSVSNELGLHMIDHRVSTSEPTDATGLPHFVNGKARFAPFDELFPLQDAPVPVGKQGWMLFLDEFNSGNKSVEAAFYKLILDRMTGQHPLHDQVVITAAGNLDTDRAITSPQSTAMVSRMVHLEMVLSHKEWMEDVALKENYDSRIIAYLSQFDSHLMDFKPDSKGVPFCCPR